MTRLKKGAVLILDLNNRHCYCFDFKTGFATESESSISCQAAIGLSAKFSYGIIQK